jgi:hypothetical protein
MPGCHDRKNHGDQLPSDPSTLRSPVGGMGPDTAETDTAEEGVAVGDVGNPLELHPTVSTATESHPEI